MSEWSKPQWLLPNPYLGPAHAFRPDLGSQYRSSACGVGYKASELRAPPQEWRQCIRCLRSLVTAGMTDDWNQDALPDFTQLGFHTGKKVQFTLSDGRTMTDIYQGWGIFGTGSGYLWGGEENPHVVAWRPAP